jgi:hypothetical protein
MDYKTHLLKLGIDEELVNQCISKIGKAYYGVIDNGAFGVKIVTGIVTGFTFEEKTKPNYQLTLGANKYWSQDITTIKEEILDFLKIADLQKIKESHIMQLKYK